jgi:glucose-6-phosphate 1-dehydrogenase
MTMTVESPKVSSRAEGESQPKPADVLETYERGTWGPKAARGLVKGHGRWHGPWVTE